MLFSALTVALRHFFYSKKVLIVPSNRKPPPSITVIGNPPDANRHEYRGGRYAQNSCKGKRHSDGMPSNKKIKEILLPARCEALSAISALSAGHYYLMRIVFYCPDFYCPAEIKEIAEIIVTDPREALSAISAGNKHLPRENRIVPQK